MIWHLKANNAAKRSKINFINKTMHYVKKVVGAITKLHELIFELLFHLSYSADLAPKLERMLQGDRCGLNGEVIAANEAFFEDKDKSLYRCIITLE